MADKIYGDTTARQVAVDLTVPQADSTANTVPSASTIVQPIADGESLQTGSAAKLTQIENTINAQITAIQEKPLEVDTTALIGVINDSFDLMKNRITESSLASVKKSALEMDTYFKSPTGDQRAGARIKMAQSVKSNLMQSAYQAISSVYDKHTNDIINVSLEAAKINANVAGIKANAVTALLGEMNNVYLGVLAESNKTYIANLNASIETARMQLDTQYKYDALDQEMEQFNQNLTFEKWKTGEMIGIDKAKLEQDQQQFEKQLDQDRYKFDTELEFNKWKTEETLAWEKSQFNQQFQFEEKKYDDQKKAVEEQKNEIAKQSTMQMLENMTGKNKTLTATDVLKQMDALNIGVSGTFINNATGDNRIPDDTRLKAAGWPDQERVKYFLERKVA
jgi:hypothetical protein